MIRLGVVQAESCSDVQGNLDTLCRLVAQASRERCPAVCFPECFLTGYRPEAAALRAICVDSPVLEAVSAGAEAKGLDILVGFMERSGDRFYITHGLFRRDGTREYYRKTHLGEREACVFTPGDSLPVMQLSCGISVGIQLCVESHFPEISQTLALKGAEVIFAPHAAPRIAGDRRKIWSKYIPARSYDNRVYLLCCNLWDPERFGGGCLATDPSGEILGEYYGGAEHLLTVQIDEVRLGDFRSPGGRLSARFYPDRRRPELYTHNMEKTANEMAEIPGIH